MTSIVVSLFHPIGVQHLIDIISEEWFPFHHFSQQINQFRRGIHTFEQFLNDLQFVESHINGVHSRHVIVNVLGIVRCFDQSSDVSSEQKNQDNAQLIDVVAHLDVVPRTRDQNTEVPFADHFLWRRNHNKRIAFCNHFSVERHK